MYNSELIGSSTKFRAVFDDIGLVAPVDPAVLIRSKSAPARKVIAQAIHEASSRGQQSFRVSQMRGDPISGIRGNSRNSRDSRERDRDVPPIYFIYINLEMAGGLHSLRSIARWQDVIAAR